MAALDCLSARRERPRHDVCAGTRCGAAVGSSVRESIDRSVPRDRVRRSRSGDGRTVTLLSSNMPRNANEALAGARDSDEASAMRGFVCMIAYTHYPIDARVRREAETLAA